MTLVVSPMFPVRCVTYVPGLYRRGPTTCCSRPHPAGGAAEFGTLGGLVDRLEGSRTMTTTPQSYGPPSGAQDVAKLGPFRPPLVYLASLVTRVLIQRAAPLPFVPGT